MEVLSVDAIPERQGVATRTEVGWLSLFGFSRRGQDRGSVKVPTTARTVLPRVRESLSEAKARRFVLDGEIAVPEGTSFSFDALLQRIIRQLCASSLA